MRKFYFVYIHKNEKDDVSFGNSVMSLPYPPTTEGELHRIADKISEFWTDNDKIKSSGVVILNWIELK